jgi:hypothetical protein
LGDGIKENEMGEHGACIGKKINVYRSLFGKSQGKRPLRRLRRKGNVIRREGVDWINLVHYMNKR